MTCVVSAEHGNLITKTARSYPVESGERTRGCLLFVRLPYKGVHQPKLNGHSQCLRPVQPPSFPPTPSLSASANESRAAVSGPSGPQGYGLLWFHFVGLVVGFCSRDGRRDRHWMGGGTRDRHRDRHWMGGGTRDSHRDRHWIG